MSTTQIQDQLERAIDRVWHGGQRISEAGKVMQTFEKRMTINGLTARYKLVVDTAANRIVTFFPAISGG
jgi:hypothetical protein